MRSVETSNPSLKPLLMAIWGVNAKVKNIYIALHARTNGIGGVILGEIGFVDQLEAFGLKGK